MEQTQGHSQRASCGTGKEGCCKGKTGQTCKVFKACETIYKVIKFFVAATIHYSWVTFIAAILILGGINFYDIVFSDNVPEIHAMYGDMKNAYNRTDAHLSKGDFNEHRGWVALQPALQILDDICPQASKWAREQHESGKLVWLNQSEDSYAKYSHIHRNLMINVDLFTLTNGERACTIAHEFRHSRQNLSKSLKTSASLLLTGNRNEAIIEDDAYLFEGRVRESIYGWPHGRR